jgi:hypothetical protein
VTRGYWSLSDWTDLGALAVLVLGLPCAALLAFVGIAYRENPKAPWWIAAFLLAALGLKAIGSYAEAAMAEEERSISPAKRRPSPEVEAELDALVTWKVPEPLLPYNRMQAADGFWMSSSHLNPQSRAFGEVPFRCVQQKDHLPKESPAAQRSFAKFLAYFDATNNKESISEEEEKERIRLIEAAIKAGSWRAELSYWLWVDITGYRGDLERSHRVVAELLRMAEGRNPAIVAAAAARIWDDNNQQPPLNDLLRSGLERGSPQVMTDVGGRLAVNVPEHRARGLAMLRCAADQGDVDAYHPLGLTARLVGRWVDAHRIFELGANQGCRRCAQELEPKALQAPGFPGTRGDFNGATPEINRLNAFYAAQYFWQITGLSELRQPAPPSIQLHLSDVQVMGLIGLRMKETGLKPAPR